MDDHKVVCVANIVTNPQALFNKLVKFIYVDISEKLRCKIANRRASYFQAI